MPDKKKNVNHDWKYARKYNNANVCISENLNKFDSSYMPKRNRNFNKNVSCNNVNAFKSIRMR